MMLGHEWRLLQLTPGTVQFPFDCAGAWSDRIACRVMDVLTHLHPLHSYSFCVPTHVHPVPVTGLQCPSPCFCLTSWFAAAGLLAAAVLLPFSHKWYTYMRHTPATLLSLPAFPAYLSSTQLGR